jgi:type IX secretion system PorP/SprF family membrane protein
VGLDGAPVTTYLTIQGPIGKQDDRSSATTLFPEKSGVNLRGKNYWDEYVAAPSHHGVGLQVVNDVTGPFTDFSLMGTYAYHMGIGPRTNLSAGLGLGVRKLTLNSNKVNFGPDYPVDPAVWQQGTYGKATMDASAGIWLYSSDYFIGVSGQQLLPEPIDYSDNEIVVNKGKVVPHLFGTAGYRFMVGENFNLLPSIMVKDVNPIPVQVDYNAKLEYQDLAWIGGSYRGKYGYAGMVGLNVLNTFTISYSYDYSTTALNTVSNGTNEIVVGFILGNRYSDETCPKRLW